MEFAGEPTPLLPANPATAKSGMPSPLKSPFAMEKRPVWPTSLPAMEYNGGAAKLAGELVCDDGKDASSPQVNARPRTQPKRTKRTQREAITLSSLSKKLLYESKNGSRADVPSQRKSSNQTRR